MSSVIQVLYRRFFEGIMPDINPRVFLSYARSDGEEFASHLRVTLEKLHIPVWQDRIGLEGGRDWWIQITKALDTVEFLVIIITPNALRSEFVRKEWHYARQHGVCVYPVKGVPNLDFNSLPKWMRKCHFYDLGFDHDHLISGPEWEKFQNDLNTRCQMPRMPFMVDDIRDFVARPKEFEALVSFFLTNKRDESSASTAAFRGPGGYGKTTLARAICHHEEIQQAFDDGILWVTLGNHVNEADLYIRVDSLIYALTGEKSDAPTLDSAIGRLVDLLADRDMLLVLDDVWHEADLRPFLQGGRRCARLITTRYPNRLPPNTFEVVVDAMTAEEAVALLTRYLPHLSEPFPFSAEKLINRLGKWPLLLRLANSVLRTQMNLGKSFPDAVDYAHRALTRRGLSAFDATDGSERHDAVGRTLDVTLDLLTPEDNAYFSQLAIFPSNVDVPLQIVECLWGVDDLESEAICGRLYNSSLLLELNLQKRQLRLHEVIRQYLRDSKSSSLQSWNKKLLSSKLPVDGWPTLPQNEQYMWRHLGYHLAEAGEIEHLRALLFMFDYLEAKLRALGTNALILDCVLLPQDTAVQLIRSALSLSAHVLARDSNALAHQLVGRLARYRLTEPRIRLLTDQIMSLKHHLFPLDPNGEYSTHESAGGALLRVLSGHTDAVRSVAWSPDGRRIVSGSADNTLIIWDAETGVVSCTMSSHTDAVRSAAWSPDGRRIVSGSADNTLIIWDAETGVPLLLLGGHLNAVNSVAWSPDGQYIVSASDDDTLVIWEAQTGAQLSILREHQLFVTSVDWSSDGQHIVSASEDTKLIIWNSYDGGALHTLRGHRRHVSSVDWSSDGQRIVSASWDGALIIWDAASGAIIHKLEGHSDYVSSGAWSPDGQRIVSASWDGALIIWDAASGAIIHKLEGHSSAINCVVWSPDGQRIASVSDDRTVMIWEPVNTIAAHRLRKHSSWVLGGAWSPDGKRFVSTSSEVLVWEAKTGAVLQTFKGHSAPATSAMWSPDGRMIVSGASDLVVCDAETGNLLHTLKGHKRQLSSVAWSPDGRWIASAAYDSTIIVWEAGTGSVSLVLRGHHGPVSSIAWNAAGNRIVSGSYDATLIIWDLETGSVQHILSGHLDSITSVGWSPDSSLIVSTSHDTSLIIWYVETGSALRRLEGHSEVVYSAAWSPDNKRIISTSADMTLRIWNAQSGKLLSTYYSDAIILVCAFSSDGQSIAAGDSLGQLQFLRWNE